MDKLIISPHLDDDTDIPEMVAQDKCPEFNIWVDQGGME